MEPAAEILPRLYRKFARQAADQEALLLALWPAAVGERIAARTRPLRMFGQTLIVEAAAQDWRKELARMTGQILRKLNDAAGREMVRDIEFRVATTAAARPVSRASTATGRPSDEASDIADPQLRRLYRISRARRQARGA